METEVNGFELVEPIVKRLQYTGDLQDIREIRINAGKATVIMVRRDGAGAVVRGGDGRPLIVATEVRVRWPLTVTASAEVTTSIPLPITSDRFCHCAVQAWAHPRANGCRP